MATINIVGDAKVGKTTFARKIQIKRNIRIWDNKVPGTNDICIVLYDITNLQNFLYAKELIAKLPSKGVALVGNKTDLVTFAYTERMIEYNEGSEVTENFFEVSAKTEPVDFIIHALL
jgi:GTPase SAR1 family protein